ncbi:MAG: 2-oxo-4-hydroxy-4-carboxy-5-ureidoimidazoline decarboxylase [Pyrinomonadaceae bacterium]|nr:2-oxo-4-hydroxy-4-carboxy-5-ureidoimidazoline decarboxylase [Pyrinomonadaceae bacterium]
MEPGLERLNSLPADEAEAELGKCCGSTNWARRMAAERPFANLNQLVTIADRIWCSLEPDDWLQAFASHPKIGEIQASGAITDEAPNHVARADRAGTPENWAAQEQSGAQNATEKTARSLAELNRDYEEKFGYIYIVCATGKSSEEMLTVLQKRLPNDAETELRIAAREQFRITKLRLGKLINL